MWAITGVGAAEWVVTSGRMRWRRCRRLATAWLVSALPALATAATITVGPAGEPEAFEAALARAGDGDEIVLLPGEYRGVVGVINQKKLTIRGAGGTTVLIGDGKTAEGKALLVVRDGDVRLENLEFRGARVPEGNGAGVRFEKGRLTVVNCRFYDNEHGLLTGNEPDAELEIVGSVFGQAPRVVGGLHHLLYVGRIGRVTVTGSRFRAGFEGHLIKSRARETRILYNVLRDGNEGGASYEIDLPNGGLATIIGNVIGQGAATQNPVVIAYGAETQAWERNALHLSHNTLISEGWWPAWFLRVFRDRIRDPEVIAVNNLVVGAGIFELGASGTFAGNRPAMLGMLADVTTSAFELPPGSWLRGTGVDPRQVRGRDLAPRFEFELPAGTRPLNPDRASWSPGAFQR